MARRYLGVSENVANTPLDTTVIPVVADDAARDDAFPAPEENQRVHNLDADAIERFDGADWVTSFVGSATMSTALSTTLSTALSAASSAASA